MQLTANSLLFSNKIIEERKRNDTVVVGIVGDSRCQNKIQHFFFFISVSLLVHREDNCFWSLSLSL